MSINQLKTILKRRETFCASHFLSNPNLTEKENNALYKKCTRHHGHNYVLFLSVTGKTDPNTGMIIEFEKIKQVLSNVIIKFDHQHLNNLTEFNNKATTLENFIQILWRNIQDELPKDIKIKEIELFETEKNSVILTS